jgi:hypothetical protein
MCSLPPGDYNLTGGCRGDSIPANFSILVCSPTGKAGSNTETGFMRCSPNCHYRKQWLAKDKILIYIRIFKAYFSKIVAFKATNRNF